MDNQIAADFIESFYEDVIQAMNDADQNPVNSQYRLGVRRLASAFFHKIELFEVRSVLPRVENVDVDAWFSQNK